MLVNPFGEESVARGESHWKFVAQRAAERVFHFQDGEKPISPISFKNTKLIHVLEFLWNVCSVGIQERVFYNILQQLCWTDPKDLADSSQQSNDWMLFFSDPKNGAFSCGFHWGDPSDVAKVTANVAQLACGALRGGWTCCSGGLQRQKVAEIDQLKKIHLQHMFEKLTETNLKVSRFTLKNNTVLFGTRLFGICTLLFKVSAAHWGAAVRL